MAPIEPGPIMKAIGNKKLRHVLAFTLSTLGCLPGMSPAFAWGATERIHGTQGKSWASIKRLPDWTGVWVLNIGKQMPAFGPLTPAYRKLRDEAIAANNQPNLAKCLPAGTPGILQHGVLHEYVMSPGRVTILIEDGEVRRIYTDGRAHRALAELTTSYEGDSIGHWEGQALVVDTVGFPLGTLWKDPGVVATIHSHLVERIFRNSRGQMEIHSTLTDPAIFTKPYVYVRRYDRTSLPLSEPACAVNNRDTGDTIDLTPPPEDN